MLVPVGDDLVPAPALNKMFRFHRKMFQAHRHSVGKCLVWTDACSVDIQLLQLECTYEWMHIRY